VSRRVAAIKTKPTHASNAAHDQKIRSDAPRTIGKKMKLLCRFRSQWRERAHGASVEVGGGGRMQAEWDESYFEAQQQGASVYWVCFWTADDVEQAAQRDPQRITGADSVEEVLAWLARERGERRFELFVEAVDPIAPRNLIRLAGDFRPGGTSVTFTMTRSD
jgi:hypothetical protein